ncbi:hypothetical protein FISHEDRAFT_54191 [Fistulina hepatica ATCC 64428]|uniref:Cytochrome P450 n=1 Tax=Fistulina hepatica ATCC 64428 TaxID=1128425 RepID=A0A0D7A2B9_9AGAR|nr:hypothetical protein FISHEDRAFT_54191 [Fistulina hepatica ATCC 64428]
MPKKMPWLHFTEWKAQYGTIFSLNLAGQPVVVLNSHKATGDLLDRCSGIYSDRPCFIMAGELLTGGIFMVFAPYGEVWRKMCHASNKGFGQRAIEQYKVWQFKGAALNVLDIMESPQSWVDHLKVVCSTTASNILTAVYGWPWITAKDKQIVS